MLFFLFFAFEIGATMELGAFDESLRVHFAHVLQHLASADLLAAVDTIDSLQLFIFYYSSGRADFFL